MSVSELFNDISALYAEHGWQLRRVLLRPDTRAHFGQAFTVQRNVPVIDASIDALWFSRPSHLGREAWELRLLSENPYALFETFEADETEEQREEMRQETENRLREYATKEST